MLESHTSEWRDLTTSTLENPMQEPQPSGTASEDQAASPLALSSKDVAELEGSSFIPAARSPYTPRSLASGVGGAPRRPRLCSPQLFPLKTQAVCSSEGMGAAKIPTGPGWGSVMGCQWFKSSQELSGHEMSFLGLSSVPRGTVPPALAGREVKGLLDHGSLTHTHPDSPQVTLEGDPLWELTQLLPI